MERPIAQAGHQRMFVMCLSVVCRITFRERVHSDDEELCMGSLQEVYRCRRAAASLGCGCVHL